ncbi:hypothetical protein ACHAWF_003809 [Thalassiosira exigua]
MCQLPGKTMSTGGGGGASVGATATGDRSRDNDNGAANDEKLEGRQGTRGQDIAESDSSPWRDNVIPTKGTGEREWWIRGGMHVNEVGMGITLTLVSIFLATTAASASLHERYTVVQIFATVFVLQVVLAYAAHGMRTVFCVVACPVYMTSLLVLPGTLESRIVPTLGLALGIAIWRVGVCMSVCLHRYAAHAAFKCGPATQFLLNVMGSLAFQGGPIWWASQHRCHHKYCDVPRDPHSAIVDGTERAFSFFQEHNSVEEEFAPRHNDAWHLRLLDTWSSLVCTAEMIAAYLLFGREGLFISFTSMWLCQTITLWFNVANHPEDHAPGQKCKASDNKARPSVWYPAFLLLDLLYPLFAVVVGEDGHEDHHKHSMLAKRSEMDCAYFFFVLPLEVLGLVWNVRVSRFE